MSRKKKKREYYGEIEEIAVVSFLNAETIEEKERIYRESLQKPINKMIESIIRRYKLYRRFYNFDELHADTLSFLMTKFEKFNPDMGNKSYSYYGTICKNYLYNEMIREYRRKTSFLSSEETSNEYLQRDDLLYTIDNDDDVDLTDYIEKLVISIKEILDNQNLSDNEFKIGHSLVKILEEWKELFADPKNTKDSSKFNKNLILLYIRNITGLNTKEIRNGMKKYKVLYGAFKNNYFS